MRKQVRQNLRQMNIDEIIKDCTKPHVLLHSLSGLGLGILLSALIPGIAYNGFVLGLILIVAGVGGEYVIYKK